jgi:predicted outer membrane protein
MLRPNSGPDTAHLDRGRALIRKAGQDFKSAVKEAPNTKQQQILRKLQGAKGKSFDQAYVKAQLDAHKEAVTRQG